MVPESFYGLLQYQTEHKFLEHAVEPEAAGFVSSAPTLSLLQLQAWYKHSACSDMIAVASFTAEASWL